MNIKKVEKIDCVNMFIKQHKRKVFNWVNNDKLKIFDEIINGYHGNVSLNYKTLTVNINATNSIKNEDNIFNYRFTSK